MLAPELFTSAGQMPATTPENLRAEASHVGKQARGIVDEHARRTLSELAAEYDARATPAAIAVSGTDPGTAESED